MPRNSSYWFNPLAQSWWKTPAATHCWNLKCAVELLQMPVAFSAFHWQPVRKTKKIPFIAVRSATRGRPPLARSRLGGGGSSGWSSDHSASEISQRPEGFDDARMEDTDVFIARVAPFWRA